MSYVGKSIVGEYFLMIFECWFPTVIFEVFNLFSTVPNVPEWKKRLRHKRKCTLFVNTENFVFYHLRTVHLIEENFELMKHIVCKPNNQRLCGRYLEVNANCCFA